MGGQKTADWKCFGQSFLKNNQNAKSRLVCASRTVFFVCLFVFFFVFCFSFFILLPECYAFFKDDNREQ